MMKLMISGKGDRSEVAISEEGAVIGLGAECNVQLDDPHRYVSRQHARMFCDAAGRWLIEDLDSRNGTWIGGERISSRPVLPGEDIRIGPYLLSLTADEDTWIPADAGLTSVASIMDGNVPPGPFEIAFGGGRLDFVHPEEAGQIIALLINRAAQAALDLIRLVPFTRLAQGRFELPGGSDNNIGMLSEHLALLII